MTPEEIRDTLRKASALILTISTQASRLASCPTDHPQRAPLPDWSDARFRTTAKEFAQLSNGLGGAALAVAQIESRLAFLAYLEAQFPDAMKNWGEAFARSEG